MMVVAERWDAPRARGTATPRGARGRVSRDIAVVVVVVVVVVIARLVARGVAPRRSSDERRSLAPFRTARMVDAARARLAAAGAGSSASSASTSLPSVTAGEVADDVAVRGKRFIDGFTKTALDATMRNVNDASERLRVTVLNAAIQSEASATSDLPTLERAVIAMRCVCVGLID